MDIKVVIIINMINDEVINMMEVDFVSDSLVGVLWNFWKDEIEKYDDVVSSLLHLCFYTKTTRKLYLNLKN